MELHYWEKQLILYTKGHFKRIDYDKDLKLFASNLYGLGLENTDPYNVFSMVVHLYQGLVDDGFISFKLDSFITNIFKRAAMQRSKSEVNYDDVLRHMLAEIQYITVINTGLDLGKPDSELSKVIQNVPA